MISARRITNSERVAKIYFKQQREPLSLCPRKSRGNSQKGISTGVFMHFGITIGAMSRTTAVHNPVTDVNMYLRKLKIRVSTDPKKNLEHCD